jgi:pheromone shutdown-related protein TraB
MVQQDSFYIIGTSHVSKQSVNDVKNSFEEFNPDIIALELDILRFQSLIAKKQKRNLIKEIKHLGVKGVLLNTIGAWIENKIGQKVNMKPGAEMKTAIGLARIHKKEIALIDQDIRITLKRLTKEVKIKEKLRIFLDLFRIPFAKKQMEKIDLTKVPEQEFIDDIIKKVKNRYPGIYKVLIKERNKIIAKNLNKLKKDKKDKKILAIIGAGHKKEVEKLISNGNF